MSKEQQDAAAKPKGSAAFRSRALVAYVLILSSLALAVGFLAWNLQRHMDEGHRYRLLELRRASEALEELFELNLKNVANVYESKSKQDIEVNDRWVKEITARQPFLTYERITGEGESAELSSLGLDSRAGSLRVKPTLPLDNVRNVAFDDLGPLAFRHGVEGEMLCLAPRAVQDCPKTKPAALEAGDAIHHRWRIEAPLPSGLENQALAPANLDLREGKLGFWAEGSEEKPASSLLDDSLAKLLASTEGRISSHGFELDYETSFPGRGPLPTGLRLWLEAPAPSVPAPAPSRKLPTDIGHLVADAEHVLTLSFPQLPKGVGFSTVRLRNKAFGNWSLMTDRGEIELGKKEGQSLETQFGPKYERFRIAICDRDVPCYFGPALAEFSELARSLGWEHDPVLDASFVEGRSRIRLVFRPTEAVTNALEAENEISLVDPRTLRVHGTDAFVPLELDPETSLPDARLAGLLKSERVPGSPAESGLEVRSSEGRVVLSYDRSYPLSPQVSTCAGGSDRLDSVDLGWHESEKQVGRSVPGLKIRCGEPTRARFFFDLEKMLEAAVEVEDFDQWALFDDRGQGVLAYDHDPGPFRLDAPGAWDSIRAGKTSTGADEKEDSKLGGSVGLFQQDLEVAGVAARLACQSLAIPTEVRLPDKLFEQPESWHLCGLVDSSRVRREAIGLDPSRTASALLLALFLMGILAYAKPSLVAPQERIGRLDLVLLTSSTVLLLVLLSIGNLAVFRGLGARAQLDHQLQGLALDVHRELGRDLSRFARELANLDGRRCAADSPCAGAWVDDERAEAEGSEKSDAGKEKPSEVVREVLLFSNDPAADAPPTDECRLGRILLPETPPFSSIFWIDGSGQQIHKATSRNQNTPAVSVADRAYFTEARKNNGLDPRRLPDPDPLPSSAADSSSEAAVPTADPPRLFFETNRSKTTGEPFFALSRRSACAASDGSSGLADAEVVALTGKLPTMEALVTPPFGFAVVDAEGWVVLSSHERLKIRDRLLDEIRDGERLHKTLTLDAAVTLDLVFGNRNYRAHVRPLLAADAWHGTEPLRILTFYEQELARTVIAEAVLLAAILLLIYLSGVFLLAVLLRRRLHQLFWPKPAEVSGYTWEVLILLVLAIVAVLYWFFRGAVGLPSLVPTLLLAILGAWLYFAWRRGDFGSVRELPLLVKLFGEPGDSKGRERARRHLELMAGLLGILIGVVPGLLFFELGWQFQVRSLDSQARSWWRSAEQQRVDRLGKEWRATLPEDRFVAMLDTTTSDRFHLPLLALPGASPLTARLGQARTTARAASSGFRGESEFLGFLSDSLPIYNRTSEKIRFQWRELSGESGFPSAWPLALMAPLISLAAVLWMFSVRRRLEIRIGADPPVAELGALLEKRQEVGEPKLVVLTSGDQWDRMEACADVERVDLSTADPKVDEKRKDPLFVTGLAQALAEESLRESSLKFLSTLVGLAKQRPVWIFTATDPYRLLEEAVAEGEGRRESGAILDFGDAFRWVNLLGRFQRIFAPIDAEKLAAIPDDRQEDAFWPILWCCSDSERLAMLHLASEGMVNPKQSAAVESLAWRGLLTTERPERPLSFFSDRFRQFVYEHAATGQLLALEREAGKKGWRSLRMVFVTLLAIVFCFLFFLDNELLESLVGLLTGLAAILPLGLGLLSRLGQQN